MTDDLKFTAEDFDGLRNEFWFPELLARANAILAAKLLMAPMVMGYADGVTWHDINLREPEDDFTHRARLVTILPLEGQPT